MTPQLFKKLFAALLFIFLVTVSIPAQGQGVVSGTVFHDENKNGQLDSGEPGISGVMISNGSDIVTTDEEGRYEIRKDENTILFVIKPEGWTTGVDANNIPQFYTILSSEGAGGSDFQGLPPTDPLPNSVDFALYPQEESDEFRVVVFGDTQPRTMEEVNYLMHDSVQELIGVEAAFGTTLGDIVFDDLDLFDPLNEVIGQIGIPWRHVIGNHDIDFSADTNWDVRGAYYRTYGPPWYAFTWGSTHFVAVDNIRWIVDGDERYYRTGLGEEQMNFISNFLENVPDDELVVFLMHIPWVDSTPWKDESERDQLFEIIASHSHTASLAAHTHRHFHRFIGEGDGWIGDDPHHMVSMATVCGAWWTGAHDEYGIPHSMMRDGTPTGYTFLDIDGNDWELSFKAARRPADFQMHVSAPDEISLSDAQKTEVFANVFNALPDAKVEMRVGKEGEWQIMTPTEQKDPVFEAMKNREHALENVTWRRANNTHPNPRHLWKSYLPDDLTPGTYTIFIRSEDEWNLYEGRRIMRITDKGSSYSE